MAFRTWFFIDGPLDVLVTASCSRLEDAAVQNFQSPLIDLLRPGAGKGTNPESRPEDVGNPRESRTCVKAWFLLQPLNSWGGGSFIKCCCNLKISQDHINFKEHLSRTLDLFGSLFDISPFSRSHLHP